MSSDSTYLVAVDPARKAGWALWEGLSLLRAGFCRVKGKQGRWLVSTTEADGHGNDSVVLCESDAWEQVFHPGHPSYFTDVTYVREGCITQGPSTVRSAEIAGRIDGHASACGALEVRPLPPSTWRRIIREAWDTGPWPAGTDAKKAKAEAICVERLGMPPGLPNDVYDAVLIGAAHLLSTGVGVLLRGWKGVACGY